jgi:hypothetical protein
MPKRTLQYVCLEGLWFLPCLWRTKQLFPILSMLAATRVVFLTVHQLFPVSFFISSCIWFCYFSWLSSWYSTVLIFFFLLLLCFSCWYCFAAGTVSCGVAVVAFNVVAVDLFVSPGFQFWCFCSCEVQGQSYANNNWTILTINKKIIEIWRLEAVNIDLLLMSLTRLECTAFS